MPGMIGTSPACRVWQEAQKFFRGERLRNMLAEYQAGASSAELGERYGCDGQTILNTLKREGIPRHRQSPGGKRTHAVNEAFFARGIVNEATAYVAGFHAADGHASSKGWVFQLQRRDRGHLLVLRSLVGYGGPVVDCVRPSFGKPNACSLLQIHSTRLCGDLSRLGLGGHKTYRLVLPPMPSGLLRHFLRGLVDGDGWVTGCGNCSVGLCGTLAITTAFAEFVANSLLKPLKVPRPHSRNADVVTCWRVLFQGRLYAGRTAALLYDGCTVALERKAQAARQLIANL